MEWQLLMLGTGGADVLSPWVAPCFQRLALQLPVSPLRYRVL